MKQLKLNPEEGDLLAELLESESFKVLLKAIEALVANQEGALRRISIDAGAKPLIHAKLRAEGARKLHSDLEQLKDFLKGKQAPPKPKRA